MGCSRCCTQVWKLQEKFIYIIHFIFLQIFFLCDIQTCFWIFWMFLLLFAYLSDFWELILSVFEDHHDKCSCSTIIQMFFASIVTSLSVEYIWQPSLSSQSTKSKSNSFILGCKHTSMKCQGHHIRHNATV